MRMSMTTEGLSALCHGTDAIGEKKSLIEAGEEYVICAKTQNWRIARHEVRRLPVVHKLEQRI